MTAAAMVLGILGALALACWLIPSEQEVSDFWDEGQP